MSVYAGTKYFLEGLSTSMRLELGGTGIKITCVQPGDTATPISVHNTDKEAS